MDGYFGYRTWPRMSLIEWLPKFHEGKLRLVLGSASVARRKIIEQLGVPVEVIVSEFAEDLDKSSFEDLSEYPVATSMHKTKDLIPKLPLGGCAEYTVLVTCDTVVIRDDRFIMEKPVSKEHAIEMITSLSGKDHTVVTGIVVTLIDISGATIAQNVLKEVSTVRMVPLSSKQIECYVSSGEPMGKAGGYGIQGLGELLVRSVTGSYTNVVGLPLHEVSHCIGTLLFDNLGNHM